MPNNILNNIMVNELYSNQEIFKSLHVSNAGGVRVHLDNESRVRRMVVMTSVPDAKQLKENPYHDRVEGDVMVYTGAGRFGDQRLSGVNKRIPEQPDGKFPIYCFALVASRRNKEHSPKRWQFLGMLEYLRHYQETQIDALGVKRQVWVFELRVHREPHVIDVRKDADFFRRFSDEVPSSPGEQDDDRQVVLLQGGVSQSAPDALAFDVEALRGRLLGVGPKEFEELVKVVLVNSGFERVVVTKFSQDGGIDVVAYPGRLMWPIKNILIQVQAKRWLHTVGRREVAELRGSLEQFARGVVVTTSHFSKAAIREAASAGKNPIILVNGYELSRIIIDLNLKII